MKKNKLNLLMSFLVSIPLLAGCSSGNNKWGFNAEEADKATYIDATITKKGTDHYEFNVSETYPYFADSFTLDDVLCFNVSEVAKEISETPNFDNNLIHNIDFYRKHSVKTSDLQLFENHGKVIFTFEGNDTDYFSCLFSKDASAAKNFISAEALETYSDATKRKSQSDFEINYLEMEDPKWIEGGTRLDIYSYFNNIFEIPTKEAKVSKNQTRIIPIGAIIKAIEITSQVVGAVVEAYQEAVTPTIEDVYDKLLEIDDHITQLSYQIKQVSERMETLFNEQVMLQEKTQFNQYTKSINDFELNIESKVNDCVSLLNQYLGKQFKDFISQDRNISIFYKVVGDNYTVSDVNDGTYTEYRLFVSDFSSAKEHIASHGNSIEKGFTTALQQDFIRAAIHTQRPDNVTEKAFASNIFSVVQNRFLREFYSSNDGNTTAFELRQAFINYANGVAKSLVNAQLERTRLMSNFAGEASERLRQIFTNILYKLDKICALATIASEYAGLSSISEIGAAYEAARKTILGAYEYEKKLEKNYSYVVQAPISGSTIAFEAVTSVYNSEGKHTGYNRSYTVYNRYGDVNEELSYQYFTEHALSEEQAIRITKRFALLDDTQRNATPFIDYLIRYDVYPEEQVVDKTGKRYATSFVYNKLTDEVPFTPEDKSLDLIRTSKYIGVGSSDSFESGRAHYGDVVSDKWNNAVKLYGNTFDANTGLLTGPKMLTASAGYKNGVWIFGRVEHSFKLEKPEIFYTLFK